MAALPLPKPTFRPDELAPLTVDQYHRMIDEGILDEGEPVELLDGLLVQKDRGGKMTVSPRHRLVVTRLLRLASEIEKHGAHLQIQNPVTIRPRNEPEPDAAIVAGQPSDYSDRHPGPGDVSCVIEVAETSLERDRTLKLSIYAGAGIAQYVLVNLVEGVVEVYEGPDRQTGTYRMVQRRDQGTSVALLLPDGSRVEVSVEGLVP